MYLPINCQLSEQTFCVNIQRFPHSLTTAIFSACCSFISYMFAFIGVWLHRAALLKPYTFPCIISDIFMESKRKEAQT